MKTFSLPIVIEKEEDKSLIKDLCRQQSIIVRSAYNALLKGKTVKELEQQFKSLNNTDNMDSWFIRCGILRGKTLTKNKSIIFGGKSNLSKLNKKKITKEQWKEKRLYSIELQGEVHQGGNRKLKLDLINNQIIFTPFCGTKILIKLPDLRSKWKKELLCIQNIKGCFTVRLSTDKIEIVVDEKHFVQPKTKKISGRILGIDLNPDWIGYNITDFPSNKIITKGCIETKLLNKKSGLASSHPKSKYLSNKRKFEYIHAVKRLIELCKSHHVESIALEDLHIQNGNLGNKNTNRKNNSWMRNIISNKIKMDAKIACIQVIEVNPAYSSLIGNMIHDDFDPISSSKEICRRAYYKFKKDMFYPELKSIKHLWKEMVIDCDSWKDVFSKTKTLNIRYRVPLDQTKVVSRIRSRKKCIEIYTII